MRDIPLPGSVGYRGGMVEAMGLNAPEHSNEIDCFDSTGTRIVLFNGKWLELKCKLPSTLQLLMVASPIGFDLLGGA